MNFIKKSKFCRYSVEQVFFKIRLMFSKSLIKPDSMVSRCRLSVWRLDHKNLNCLISYEKEVQQTYYNEWFIVDIFKTAQNVYIEFLLNFCTYFYHTINIKWNKYINLSMTHHTEMFSSQYIFFIRIKNGKFIIYIY